MSSADYKHFLSYGSTDQETLRELATEVDGLVVPGTIAAFQADGTRGFVLSLSASRQVPYFIDSRFPLFQNQLLKPKRSHLMLADLLGVPALIRMDRAPVPDDFSASIIQTVARRWIDFNTGFQTVRPKVFEKYAARLGESVLPEKRLQPDLILPPYMMAIEGQDGWSDISDLIWKESVNYAVSLNIENKLRRVVAAGNPGVWSSVVAQVQPSEIVAWISNLDEYRTSSEESLRDYASAIQSASDRQVQPLALYGGFFAILLGRYGLRGASHGIGFGDHRDWVELPSSGAAPARYYVSALHRYMGIDIAMALWRHNPGLIECNCRICRNRAPSELEYHDLMKHSVLARTAEIRDWVNKPDDLVMTDLSATYSEFSASIGGMSAPRRVVERAKELTLHLPMWMRVFDATRR